MIGLPSNILIEAAHEPTDIKQALSPAIYLLLQLTPFGAPQVIATEKALAEAGAFEKAVPTIDYLIQRPVLHRLAIYMQDHMKVIAHDGVGAEIDGEDVSELPHPCFDPGAAVGVIRISQVIPTAQKSTPDAAGNAVVIGCFGERNLGFAWFGHVADHSAFYVCKRSINVYMFFANFLWVPTMTMT